MGYSAHDVDRTQISYLYKLLKKIFEEARPGTSNKREVVNKKKTFLVPSMGDKKVALLNDVIKRNKNNLRFFFYNYFWVSGFLKFYIKYLMYRFPDIHFHMLESRKYLLNNKSRSSKSEQYYVPDFDPDKTTIIYLALNFETDAHATFIHYNPKKRQFKMYDPNGGNLYTKEDRVTVYQACVFYMDDFKKYYTKYYPDEKFKFQYTQESCEEVGLQMVEHYNREKTGELEDLGGYCATCTFLMIHLCLLNKSDDFKLMEKMIYKIYPPGVALSNFIREYYLFLVNMVYKVVSFAHSLETVVPDYCIGDFFSSKVIGCVVDEKDCTKLREYYADPHKYIKKNMDIGWFSSLFLQKYDDFLMHAVVSFWVSGPQYKLCEVADTL